MMTLPLSFGSLPFRFWRTNPAISLFSLTHRRSAGFKVPYCKDYLWIGSRRDILNVHMTDAQVMTLALSIAIPLSPLIYSNSRISAARDRVLAEIDKLAAQLRAETSKQGSDIRADITRVANDLTALRTDMNHGFERSEAALRIHELEHHK